MDSFHSGDMIKYLRKKNNMTQEDLGKVLGVKKAAVQKYESGNISNLKADTIKKLCEHFHVFPWAFLFSGEFYDYMKKIHEEKPDYFFTADMDILNAISFYNIYAGLSPDAKKKVNEYMIDLSKIPEYKLPII